MSKVTERAVVNQLFKHCNDHAPLPMNQSAYRQFHSTETALLRVHSDIVMSMDKQELTLLILVDLSAAFDTIDHEIMLGILETDFGVVGDAQKWIKSFLSKRQQCIQVLLSGNLPRHLDLTVVFDRGAVWDQFFFSCMPHASFTWSANTFQHLTPTRTIHSSISHFARIHQQLKMTRSRLWRICITDVRAWLVSHRLMFNDMKTEFVIIGSRQQLSKVTIDSVKVGDSKIKPIESVRNLGA